MDEARTITCEDVNRDEMVEKYLLDQLSEGDRDAFEQHYFECARCFGLLQTHRDVQAELAGTRQAIETGSQRSWVWRWAWVPALAVVVLAVSVTVLQRPPSPPTEPPPPGISSPAPSPLPAPSPGPTLADLALVDPPRYVPSQLRGTADPATTRFQRAMEQYQRGEYARARAGLREASALDPEAPHILFFLGVSALLTGDPDAAIDALTKTVQLGESPYLEEAHFFRAKAWLQKGNTEDATIALERTIRLTGEREAEARGLLEKLRAITKR